MTETTIALRRQIASAADLKTVVRTMKASAAAAIGQYERSVAALADYARTVELGLCACLRSGDPSGPRGTTNPEAPRAPLNEGAVVHAIVFGSDQGLVGRFNEVVVEHARAALAPLPVQARVWTVGERVQARWLDAGLLSEGSFAVPGSVAAITRLVGQILLQVRMSDDQGQGKGSGETLRLFYNRPDPETGYAPASLRLLPLDEIWQRELAAQPWPTRQLPEVMGPDSLVLRSFIREHLFVSLFRASAASLASENASRLAAMQRADRNIGELLLDLQARFQRLRQSSIDEELFDVISGFNAMPRRSPERKKVA